MRNLTSHFYDPIITPSQGKKHDVNFKFIYIHNSYA